MENYSINCHKERCKSVCRPCKPICPPKKCVCGAPWPWEQPGRRTVSGERLRSLDQQPAKQSNPQNEAATDGLPGQSDGDTPKILEAIMKQMSAMGLKLDEKDILSALSGLNEKELFAILGLVGLIGYFVLLGFLSAEDSREA